jgi:hypothetical protein
MDLAMLPATIPIGMICAVRASVADERQADGRPQPQHRPLTEESSEHADEQPAEADGRKAQPGCGDVVEQHRHGEAIERQQVQTLDSPRLTPVDQAKHEAGCLR